MYTSKFKNIIELAASHGSSAKTKNGARKFLLSHIKKNHNSTPIFKRGLKAGTYQRGKDATNRYLKDKNSEKLTKFGIELCKLSNLWLLDDATQHAVALDRQMIAKIKFDYPYKKSTSNWAGGEHATTIRLCASPFAAGYSERVWSSNGKWSGNNSSATLFITRRCAKEFSGQVLIGGLVTLDAEKVGNREYKAAWAEQSRGFDLKTVYGWIIRGYHVKAKTLQAARKKAAKARQLQLNSALKLRAQKSKTRYESEQYKSTWVTVDDSLKSGNCSTGTQQFLKRIKREIGNVCAIRGDILLKMQDDYYTRRAVITAQTNDHHC